MSSVASEKKNNKETPWKFDNEKIPSSFCGGKQKTKRF